MPDRDRERDWAQQVPDHMRRQSEYEDYGWESRQSVLPQFRDPSVHDMPYERQYTPRVYEGRGDWEREGRRRPERQGRREREFEGEERRRREWQRNLPYATSPRMFEEHRGWEQAAGRRPEWASEEWGRPDWGREMYDEAYRPFMGERRRGYGREGGWRGRQGNEPEQRYESERGYIFGPGRTEQGYQDVWMTPAGAYMGRGPKDYRRSDNRIFEDVCERLTQHGQIDASDVEVEVNNGEVTLRGTVDSRRTKRLVEDVTDSVMGVRDVHNQLRVQERQRGEQYGPGGRMSATGRPQILQGMQVIGSDGGNIGSVKEVRQNDFLIDRALQRDIYAPFDAVVEVQESRVRLNVPADQIDDMGWQSPPIIGGEQAQVGG